MITHKKKKHNASWTVSKGGKGVAAVKDSAFKTFGLKSRGTRGLDTWELSEKGKLRGDLPFRILRGAEVLWSRDL